MAGTAEPPRELRVVASRIELADVSGRVLFPSPVQGPWLPFLRFADTTGGGDDPEGHTHLDEEVMNYVLEGRVDYEDDAGHRSELEPGALELLTAREETRHKLVAIRSAPRTRWLSVVVHLPPEAGGPSHRFQVAARPAPLDMGEAAVVRFLVGPDAPLQSGAGLECNEIEFRRDGQCVSPVGSDRRAVGYAIEGSATVGRQALEEGVGALIENSTNISIRAKSGSRLLLASAPRRLI
jgi:redox-sensitive bicupin YhaK (pirin superfamily)